MRPLWTGAIGFGLVNIPVKIFSATQDSNLDLDMLDKKSLSPIHYKRVSEATGKEVEWGNIIKGFKVNNRYVILDEKDFESANAVKTKTIEITDFVNESEIDSLYYEMPYYLSPDKSGERAYALLREALLKTKKAGVATFVMRNKESLALLRPSGNVIVLNRLRFAEEIRDPKEIGAPAKTTVNPGELKMAIALIDQLEGKFDIRKYKDAYSAQLMKIIKAKSKGTKITASPLKVVHSRAGDLLSQLKDSLGTKRKKAS
jgi:DNA end-binding protein Ku